MATDKIINTPYSMNQVVQEVLGHLVYGEIGTIKQWAFNTIPAGHLEFNGTILLKADYSELYQKALNNGMVGSGLFFEEVDSTRFKIADCSDEIFRNYGSTSGRYDKTSFNANTTSGSKIITGLGYTSFMFVGMNITGAGIPAGATIASIDSTSQVTLNQNATATSTSSLTFTGRKLGTVELGQLENITGQVTNIPIGSNLNTNPTISGAFTSSTKGVGGYYSYNTGGYLLEGGVLNLDSSKVVKAGPETRMVNRSVKYIIKAKNVVGIDPTVHQANANFLDGLTGSAYAKVLGNPSNAFQVANGVNSNEAVNLGQFSNLLSSNGYTKLPNGLILQWGTANLNAGSTTLAVFPFTFPNSCVFAKAVPIGSLANWWETTTYAMTTSSVTFSYGGTATATYKYFAIGY